jgi:hypothetical protein
MKEEILHDFRTIAYELKSLKENAKRLLINAENLTRQYDQLYQDLLANGTVIFVDRRNDGAKKSP